MHTILVIGAGKTSVFLIEYLLNNAKANKWNVIVADSSIEAITDKINNHEAATAEAVDISNNNVRSKLICSADLVISLLPPFLHILVAKDCLKHKKHLITSSYVSEDMQQLHDQAEDAGLMFMCEMGLDPGIDHMTSNQIIHGIHKVAGSITSFKSFAGGLIAPESDDNPWHYKFTWNPKNVVLAGSMGATHFHNGKAYQIPYNELYANPKKGAKIEGSNSLEYYPNRDSVSYLAKYDLVEVKTFMRATYRQQGFMKAWNILVQLGLTDATDKITDKSYASWISNKNGFNKNKPISEQIASKMDIKKSDPAIAKVKWLGILEDEAIKETNKSSADILLDVLLEKWEMKPEDKDMIIMRHEVEYVHKSGKKTELNSTMLLKGEDRRYSAMAKTVGLPMAVLAKLILTGKVSPPKGVCIPNKPAIYKPVLTELETLGIVFEEEIN